MASQRLEEKVAPVTGSSSGLRRAIAFIDAREGAVLACADLQASNPYVPNDTENDTHDVINRNGGKAIFIKTEVTDSEQISGLVAQTVKQFGRFEATNHTRQ